MHSLSDHTVLQQEITHECLSEVKMQVLMEASSVQRSHLIYWRRASMMEPLLHMIHQRFRDIVSMADVDDFGIGFQLLRIEQHEIDGRMINEDDVRLDVLFEKHVSIGRATLFACAVVQFT